MSKKPINPEMQFKPGEGVHFLNARSSAKEARRIELIVRVDRAVTRHDKPALRKLKVECADIDILAAKIDAALKG